jgi:hypothetical protein
MVTIADPPILAPPEAVTGAEGAVVEGGVQGLSFSE